MSIASFNNAVGIGLANPGWTVGELRTVSMWIAPAYGTFYPDPENYPEDYRPYADVMFMQAYYRPYSSETWIKNFAVGRDGESTVGMNWLGTPVCSYYTGGNFVPETFWSGEWQNLILNFNPTGDYRSTWKMLWNGQPFSGLGQLTAGQNGFDASKAITRLHFLMTDEYATQYMCHVGIWNRDLTPAEITLLQTRNPMAIPDGLLAYFSMNSTSDTANHLDITQNLVTTDLTNGPVNPSLPGADIQMGDVDTTAGITTVDLTWATVRASTSLIQWGLTDDCGDDTIYDEAEIYTHQFTLTGLRPSTLYYFNVVSATSDGLVDSRTFSLMTGDAPPAAEEPDFIDDCKGAFNVGLKGTI